MSVSSAMLLFVHYHRHTLRWTNSHRPWEHQFHSSVSIKANFLFVVFAECAADLFTERKIVQDDWRIVHLQSQRRSAHLPRLPGWHRVCSKRTVTRNVQKAEPFTVVQMETEGCRFLYLTWKKEIRILTSDMVIRTVMLHKLCKEGVCLVCEHHVVRTCRSTKTLSSTGMRQNTHQSKKNKKTNQSKTVYPSSELKKKKKNGPLLRLAAELCTHNFAPCLYKLDARKTADHRFIAFCVDILQA